jgi:hypothetical protein
VLNPVYIRMNGVLAKKMIINKLEFGDDLNTNAIKATNIRYIPPLQFLIFLKSIIWEYTNNSFIIIVTHVLQE